MWKSCSSTQIIREIALFSGKIYIAGTNFTQPPVVTVATNLNSGSPLPALHWKTPSLYHSSLLYFKWRWKDYIICTCWVEAFTIGTIDIWQNSLIHDSHRKVFRNAVKREMLCSTLSWALSKSQLCGLQSLFSLTLQSVIHNAKCASMPFLSPL